MQVWQWFGGSYKGDRDQRNFFPRFGIEPDKIFTIAPEMTMPEDQKRAFISERTGCIAGRELAEKFNWHIGDRITLVGDIFPGTYELKLVGIYDNPIDSSGLYFNREYVTQAMRAMGNNAQADSIGAFQLIANSPDDVARVSKAIDAMFSNSTAPTMTETEQAFVLAFASFLGNLKLYLAIICAAIMFTIMLVSANTISMSVRERVREIGVLKTLGFTRGSILGIILGESVVISIAGGAIGCVLASLLINGARHAPGAMGFTRMMAMTPALALVCILVAALIGLISSMIPAMSASRTPIVQSLRHTG